MFRYAATILFLGIEVGNKAVFCGGGIGGGGVDGDDYRVIVFDSGFAHGDSIADPDPPAGGRVRAHLFGQW